MTPNVQIATLLYPERAPDYKWFDIGTLSGELDFAHETVADLLLQPTPFNNFGIVGVDAEGIRFAILVTSGKPESEYEGALLLECAIIDSAPGYIPGFWLRPQSSSAADGLEVCFVNPKHAEDSGTVEGAKVGTLVLATFLEMIHQPDAQYQIYTATPKTNNAKRIRQGKKPMFDWHTVLIEPPRQKMPDQGGTHASPRLHDVRGHWVNRNGKRYWRKAHQRGDASIGVVFHDYKLKETQDGLGR